MPKKVSAPKPNGNKSPAARLLSALQHHPLLRPGARIGVAVSGGADSVALLRLLLEAREKLGIVLSVVHFNHKLRRRASDADERFVAKLAEQYGLPFHVRREDIAAKSKRERVNLEDAARRARYTFFEKLVSESRVDKVAVAHTADDQAETVLAHMLRGTGLAGLAGIHPEAGAVFRPFLKLRRADLRAYLRSRRQAWREDTTNRDTKRMRARIRLKLMPLLEKQFQPAVIEHLCQLAELAREDDAWLESSAELRLFLNAKEDKGAWRISLRDLTGVQPQPGEAKNLDDLWFRQGTEAMGKRLIRLLTKKVKPRSGQLSVVHVDAVLHLAHQPDSGKSVHLPGGVEVRRERDFLSFRPMPEGRVGSSQSSLKPYSHKVDLQSGQWEVALTEPSCVLRFSVIDWPPQGRETNITGVFLDRERLRGPLVVRNWQPGDWLQPLGHQKRHKLSRLLNELGVSRWEKVAWPVLASGGEIAWTRGLPVAADFAAGSATRAGVLITEVPLT